MVKLRLPFLGKKNKETAYNFDPFEDSFYSEKEVTTTVLSLYLLSSSDPPI